MDAEALWVRPDLVIPADELSFEASRSGGPGGQNVNKVSTRVTLRWCLATSRVVDAARRERIGSALPGRLTHSGELVIHCNDTRSQLQNRALARERLAGLLREALHVRKRRRATRPTHGSQVRRREGKRRRSQTKRQRGRPGGED